MSENKKTNLWQRLLGIGRKKLISAVVVVGLAAVGVTLPPEAVDAVVFAADAVIEAL